MPVLNGFETSKKILKEVRKGTIIDVPIVALDSNNDHKSSSKYRSFGISDKLNKPLIEGDLVKVFKKFFLRKNSIG